MEMPDTPRRLGIYVHFPFCVARCPYCDFNTVAVREIPHEAYRDAVICELGRRAPRFADRFGAADVVSVYFGGGTPGLWRPDCHRAVIRAVAAELGLSKTAEITVECNPGDQGLGHFEALRAAGINRVSLGTQSFDGPLLARLGRRHGPSDNRSAINAVRRAGFDNLSLDLIQGMAGQSPDQAFADVAAVIAHQPEHVSTYQLTIAARTPFGARAAAGESLVVSDDAQVEIMEGTRSRLVDAGILPYEISNAARAGRQAVHNRLYWTGQAYVGLGAGAHGFERTGTQNHRWANLANPSAYMVAARSGGPVEAFREAIDLETARVERLMTGLRLYEGLVVDEETDARFGAAARRLAANGLLAVDGDHWRTTRRGRWLLDTVLVELTV